MVAGGNLLTHYNYHRCTSRVDASSGRIRVAVRDAGSRRRPRRDRRLARTRRCRPARRSPRCARRGASPGRCPSPSTSSRRRTRSSRSRRRAPTGSRRRSRVDVRAPLVLRSARLPRLHADPGRGVSRRRHRLPVGTRRPLSRSARRAQPRRCHDSHPPGCRVTRGVRQIVRFNWPFYALAAAVAGDRAAGRSRACRCLAPRASRSTRRPALAALWVAALARRVVDRLRPLAADAVGLAAARAGLPAGRVDQHPLPGSTSRRRRCARSSAARAGASSTSSIPREMTEPSIAARRGGCAQQRRCSRSRVDFRRLPVADRHDRGGAAAALGARAAHRRGADGALHRAAPRAGPGRTGRRRRAPARRRELPRVRSRLPALPLAAHLDALLRADAGSTSTRNSRSRRSCACSC